MSKETYIPALSYDRLTPLYDLVVRLTTREKRFKRALVNQAKVKPNQEVLDLGCGTGTLTVLIKKMQPNTSVSAIDGDPKILEIAKAKAQKENLEILFEEGFSFALPYADMSFDLIVSSLFFHHLTRDNKLKTLSEVWRVLKPNGELHIADWGLPANSAMGILSRLIQLLDGFETTTDNFQGFLPNLILEADFKQVEETSYFNTMLGTIRLHKSVRP